MPKNWNFANGEVFCPDGSVRRVAGFLNTRREPPLFLHFLLVGNWTTQPKLSDAVRTYELKELKRRVLHGVTMDSRSARLQFTDAIASASSFDEAFDLVRNPGAAVQSPKLEDNSAENLVPKLSPELLETEKGKLVCSRLENLEIFRIAQAEGTIQPPDDWPSEAKALLKVFPRFYLRDEGVWIDWKNPSESYDKQAFGFDREGYQILGESDFGHGFVALDISSGRVRMMNLVDDRIVEEQQYDGIFDFILAQGPVPGSK